jgi:uncharacterized protein (DUF433 family)
MEFHRITIDSRQMGGVPCIRGLRIPVWTVVGMVADGMAVDEILAAFPDLEREDIAGALHYAAEAVRERRRSMLSAISAAFAHESVEEAERAVAAAIAEVRSEARLTQIDGWPSLAIQRE